MNSVILNSDILCRRISQVLRWLLLAICAVGFLVSLRQSWQSPIWAPRNEMAHYDAIDRFTGLTFPRPDDPITDYTFRVSREHFTWKLRNSFDGARQSMGREAYSYESQQPCLYYLVMAVPNAILKMADAPPPMQIRTLRIIQQLLPILGILLIIPIFRELELSAGVSSLNGYLLAAWMALQSAGRYATLGNDALSPLACNLGIWLALAGLRRNSFPMLAGAAAACGAAFLTKYTNILFPGLFFLFALTLARSREGWKAKRIFPLALIAFLLPAAQLLLNLRASGHLLQTSAVEGLFNSYGSMSGGPWRFLRLLLMDSVSFPGAASDIPMSLPRYLLAMLAMNTLLSAVRVWRSLRWDSGSSGIDSKSDNLNSGNYGSDSGSDRMDSERRRWNSEAFVLISCLLTLTLLAAATALNTWRPGVWWMAFRHYAGYQVFFFMAFFNIPFPMNAQWKASLQTAAAILLGFLACGIL